jgi:septal ring factor EnvC (AmiA/AmiB activator)
MRTAQLNDALQNLAAAMRKVENAIAELKAERDPLASYIFVARRQYRAANDTKSGKRREIAARLSFTRAYELGFQGGLDEWERLMGAATRR